LSEGIESWLVKDVQEWIHSVYPDAKQDIIKCIEDYQIDGDGIIMIDSTFYQILQKLKESEVIIFFLLLIILRVSLFE
jgi:hypothetical protein